MRSSLLRSGKFCSSAIATCRLRPGNPSSDGRQFGSVPAACAAPRPLMRPTSVTNLYRAILIQVRTLPDTTASGIIEKLVKARFRAKRQGDKERRSSKKSTTARRALITFQKANVGDLRALEKVAETAYGQRGRLRHEYLEPITRHFVEPTAELIPGMERSRPPAVPQKLAALWKGQFEKKKISLELPLGPGGEFGKPLDKRREANMRWHHHTELLAKTLPPIPNAHHCALTEIASGSRKVVLAALPSWRVNTIREMRARVERKTTEAHDTGSSGRRIRRLYARILAKSPILLQDQTGQWIASRSPRARPAQIDAVLPPSAFETVGG